MEAKTHLRRPSAYSFKGILSLLKETAKEWSDDKAPRLGAALAYYTVFSLAPLLIIFITVAGLVFANAQGAIMTQVQGLIGDKGSEMIESMIEAAQKPKESTIATSLGFIALIFGAAGVFIQLKDALNTVWEVPPPKAGGIWAFLRKYFLSFTFVLGLAFLALVTLVVSAGLAALGTYLEGLFPAMNVVMKVVSFAVAFGLMTFIFAMLFKYLPDAKIRWRDVWLGAAVTSVLFVIGKFGLGFYLGRAGAASAYGAAGSLVLVLLWVYYSAQILFFGAEFTQVYAQRHGSRSERAVAKTQAKTRKERLVKEIERERELLNNKLKAFRPKKSPLHRFKNHPNL